MKSQGIPCIVVVAVVAVWLGRATAQEQEQQAQQPPAWTKIGAEHKELAKSVGTWEVASKLWMQPGAPPMEFTGVAEREMVLGGRFLKETFRCQWQMMQFEGWLFQGYDTFAEEYFSIWMDNMSPIASTSRGELKDGVWTFVGNEPDNATGKPRKTRSIVELVSDDEIRMTSYRTGEDGKEFTTMQMVYKRKKAS